MPPATSIVLAAMVYVPTTAHMTKTIAMRAQATCSRGVAVLGCDIRVTVIFPPALDTSRDQVSDFCRCLRMPPKVGGHSNTRDNEGEGPTECDIGVRREQ